VLGGNYEEAFANKEDIDSEIIKRWIDKASQKRKSEVILDNEENVNPSQKRRLDDSDLGKIIEFVLDVLEDLEGTEKDDRKKILKLVMDENEYVIKLWKTIKAEERKIQVRKFIRFANVMFDIVSIDINSYNKLMAIHFIYRI